MCLQCAQFVIPTETIAILQPHAATLVQALMIVFAKMVMLVTESSVQVSMHFALYTLYCKECK